MDHNTILSLQSSHVSDALDSLGVEGVLLDIKSLSSQQKIFGAVFTIQYQDYETKPNEFKNAANYLDDVPKDSIILIDNHGRKDCTVWGELTTRVALRNQIQATVVNGAIRDLEYIRSSGYPVFSLSHTSRSGKNRVHMVGLQVPITINNISIAPEDYLFADDSATVIIPKDKLNEVMKRALQVKKNEQMMISEIEKGGKLSDIRERFHYEKPWEKF